MGNVSNFRAPCRGRSTVLFLGLHRRICPPKYCSGAKLSRARINRDHLMDQSRHCSVSLAPRQPCFLRRKTEWRDWCPRPREPPRRAAVQGGESHRSCEQPMHAYLHSSDDAHRRPSGSRELRSHLTNVPKQKHLPPLMTLHAAPTEMIMPNNRKHFHSQGKGPESLGKAERGTRRLLSPRAAVLSPQRRRKATT